MENSRTYVGKRYVPKIMGEWDKSVNYEGLSIVTYEGNSYTSKQRVPVGMDILNEEYWVVTGNYNVQIEAYRTDVKNNRDEVIQYKKETTAKLEDFYVDVSTFPTLQEGIDYSILYNKNILIPAGLYLVETLTFNNAKNISIRVDGIVKRMDHSATSNAIFNFTNCENLIIENLNTDGNITKNSVNSVLLNEDMHSVAIRNCKGMQINQINDTETSGDTLYITGNSSDIHVNKIKTVNSLMSGRNCVSIISGHDMVFFDIIGINIGIPTMPGGFDIEPNAQTESVKRIKVVKAYFETSGTHCFSIANNFNSVIEDIELNGEVVKHGNSNYYCAHANGVKRLKMSVKVSNKNSHENIGVYLNGCKDSEVSVNSIHLLTGVFVERCENTLIKGNIQDVLRNGITLGTDNKKVTFDVVIGNVGIESDSYGGLFISSFATGNTDLLIKGDYSKKINGGFAIRIESPVFNSLAENANLKGWSNGSVVTGIHADDLATLNCLGFNFSHDLASILGNHYKKGTIVYNLSPVTNVGWIATEDTTGASLVPFGAII